MNNNERDSHTTVGDEIAEEFRRCKSWISHLPTNDAHIMQHTSEFQDFILAFQRLEESHRRLVSTTINSNRKPIDASEMVFGLTKQQDLLQSILTDDIGLRVLAFLDSQSLVQLSKTCSRCRDLARCSAQQRAADLALTRQLTTPLQLLRAKEQIQGIGISTLDKHVPVPALLLSRRVLVTNCGDPEYNGVYFSTGCNGNGFTFTKPREPLQRISSDLAASRLLMSDDVSDTSNTSMRMEYEPDAVEGVALRCILAKRFSNETILWYMSKEVLATEPSEDGDVQVGDVTQVFCFWAKLMVIGDASRDICRYPSQSSILLRHGEGWQTLSTTQTVEPPIVELLD